MSTNLVSRRDFLVASSLIPVALLTGCAIPVMMPAAAMVPLNAVVLRIVIRSGVAVVQIVLEETSGIKVDIQSILDAIIDEGVKKGVPPTDERILMVVTKQTNDIFYWKLTKKVKMIRLRHDNPGKIELKVQNESPLRIELWIENSIEEFEIEVEMQDS